MGKNTLRVHQLRSSDGTGTLTYLLIDESSHRAAVIDPNKEDLEQIKRAIKEQRAVLEYVIDTHTHVDHISCANELRSEFSARTVMHENTKNKWKVVDEGDKFGVGDILRANAKNEVDVYVNDGDKLPLGNSELTILFTPGHTDNHIAVLADGNVFTGDLLLIGQAGRSDLPGGSAEEQYESFTNKILILPDSTKIYPGHDYDDNEFVLLGQERRSNPFLQQQSKEEFVALVKEFFPPVADTVEGGKVILQCGTMRVATTVENFTAISSQELEKMMINEPSLFILDVREQRELTSFGHIPHVTNIPSWQLAKRLTELPPKSQKIVVVCQSGGRSFEAAHMLVKNGFQKVYNLKQGTMGWMMSGKKIERPVQEL
ncbi:MAG: MBL fold metallo-hydrolase [Bacteroidota bacterium]